MTPHLSTILFGTLTLNSPQRILGCYISSAKLRFWPLLSKHNMLDFKPVSTPLVISTSLTSNYGTAPINATLYRQVVGGLQHLRITRPDISFVVNKLSQFMYMPLQHHWGAVKRLLHYLNGIRSLGIRLLENTPLKLHGFTDADWVGNLSSVLIPFPRVLQSNALMLIFQLRLSIV